jgi:hypothetical protein
MADVYMEGQGGRKRRGRQGSEELGRQERGLARGGGHWQWSEMVVVVGRGEH